MDDRLFVYGTLRPGQRNWRVLDRFVRLSKPATLTGYSLYDLPAGYPAIVAGEASVRGDLLVLEPDAVADAIAAADRLEGYRADDPASLYERVACEVVCSDGDRLAAQTYVWAQGRRAYLASHGVPVPGGDWLARGAGD